MKRLIFALGMIGTGLCTSVAHATAPAECFTSPAAVFAAHSNATHASYSWRVKKSERCWYADAFNTEAKAKSAPHRVATVARASTARPEIAISVSQSHVAAVMPASHQSTMAMAPVPEPHVMAAVPASPRMVAPLPEGGTPAIQIAVNAQELSRLLPVDETPADFESRFSASGYEVGK